MAPVAAIIIKESKTSKCGIGFKQAGPKEPVKISSIAVGSLFAATDLIVGMQASITQKAEVDHLINFRL